MELIDFQEELENIMEIEEVVTPSDGTYYCC